MTKSLLLKRTIFGGAYTLLLAVEESDRLVVMVFFLATGLST